MSHRTPALVAAIALALSFPAAHAARADTSKDAAPDFSGTWRLDPSKSDLPGGGHGGQRGGGMYGGGGGGGRHGGWGGGGGGGYGGGGGGWGRHRGSGGEGAEGGASPEANAGAPGGGGDRVHMGWLPGFLRVSQTNAEVEFADSAGAEVREIALVAGPYDSTKIAGKIPRDPGEWDKDKLKVERLGPNEMKIREEFALEDGGQTLVIKTHAEGKDGNGRDMKRVYHRVGA
jgi:hypothetical protein